MVNTLAVASPPPVTDGYRAAGLGRASNQAEASQSPTAVCTAHQGANFGAGSNRTLGHEGFVVLFDIVPKVAIVDHDPGRLLHPLDGCIPQPVDPFEARPVAQVESGDRVDRLTIASPFHEVACGETQHRLLQSLDHLLVLVPTVALKKGLQGLCTILQFAQFPQVGALVRCKDRKST